ncbi:MAG: hypothetical protein KKH01_01405 [Firmicutes bacterium]|nr:hypothetical protein [Bacillota bacterium]
MNKVMKKITIFAFLAIFSLVFGNQIFNSNTPSIANDAYGVYSTHSYDELPVLNLPESEYITYTDFRNNIGDISSNIVAINPATWGKIIRIDTAEELYRWSIDVSYNLKYTIYETKLTTAAVEVLLSLHYKLGTDIDYSVMKSKQFNPIGYDFYIDGIHYQQTFKGTFDGNGFEITNLYFSGYNQLTEILNEGTEIESTVSYVSYYAMFAYNEGTIQNLGLINLTYEFNFESETLFKAANIVGLNDVTGNVNHVYVIDTRTTALVSGIRMVASAGQAAGILFDNYGTFNDAYFAAKVVMNASYGSRFVVQPVLYENHSGGTYSNLAFDDTLYQETVTVSGSSFNITTPNSLATSMTTTELRSSNVVLGSGWYYYPAENNPTPKYPSLMGLNFITSSFDLALSDDPLDYVTISNYYEITDELDLIAFSKMLNYTRDSGLTPFRELNYIITGNIDMDGVAPNGYNTPTVEFSGVFAGIDNTIYIHNINIVNGIAQGSYYAGMFGLLSGQVYNLLFYSANLSLNETDNFAGVPTYVGTIAGTLDHGIIRNVLVEVDIDLGHATLGELYVGSIVGSASGLINGVYGQGEIVAQTDHVYRTDIVINPEYHMGGIVGSTNSDQLVLTDAYSAVNIYGIGTTSSSISSLTAPNTYMGGVIGKVTNTTEVSHILGLLTNEGELHANELISSFTENQYIGGVIGMTSGSAFELNITFGNFTNKGIINVIDRGANEVISAGVLVSNHDELAEFIHIYNTDTASLVYYTGSPAVGNFNNLEYTSLIYNIGSGLTLSQANNNSDMNIVSSYDYSGVYVSDSNQPSLLRFVENSGDIEYSNQTMEQTMSIAGITLSENVDFLNVTYDGTIKAYNLIMQGSNYVEKQLFVAGIAKTLTHNYSIVNGLVNGEIIIAGITSNQSNYTQPNNIYVGGFVNYNYSGDMDPNGTLSMPVATIGIINSINNANLLSRYSPTVDGISGHANVFAGGLVTFNDGDIQNSANMGDVRFQNTSNVDTYNVTFNTDATSGGSTTKYRYGTVVGGIASAVLSDKSRIYDSSNSGTILGVSKNFSRAGGILGLAIYRELEYGNVITIYKISTYITTNTTNANIQDSILSNCINYGDVSALTISISIYSDSRIRVSVEDNLFDITQPVEAYTYYNTYYSRDYGTYTYIYTRSGTQERPGINASAGGVIGYGLSVMRRMINHGQISSTDVAGGVVGATVVIDTSQYVQIDTAINYGTVRAFDIGTSATNYANFNNVDILDYETIRDHFYAVDDEFIFPDTYSDIRVMPENKRGFGGIFGRLQRGANLRMYGVNDQYSTFNFIVNMDPNVDLIGRLDQVYNYFSSLQYYVFRNAKYYSARKNDTTQTVFSGVSYFYDNSGTYGNSLYATRTNTNITIESRKYEYTYDSGAGQWLRTTYQQTKSRTEVSLYGRRYVQYANETPVYANYQTEVISRSDAPVYNASGWVAVSGSSVYVGTLNEFKYEHDLPLYHQVWDIESTKVSGSSSTSTVPNGYYLFATTLPIPTITEEATDPQGEYVYGSSFDMITDPVLQQYIYFAENGNLSDTFIDSRPNGMYVLATSSGSTFGSILPANMVFNNLLPLALDGDELPSYDIDYTGSTRITAAEDPTYSTLLLDYQALFQTRYSDKSALLDDNESSLFLEEINGSETRLYNPTVVDPTDIAPTGVITFNLNLATIDFNGGSIATVDYRILGALLPNNAVIAQTIEDYYDLPYGTNTSAYVSDYRDLLEDFVDLPPEDPNWPDLNPVFSYTFDLNNLTTGYITIGYFTSYSQVSQYFTSFLNDNYVTDYQVRLNVTYDSTPTLPYLYSYQIDGGSVITSITSNITTDEVGSTLVFNFRDPGFILPIGIDILELGSDNMDNVTLEYYDTLTSSYVFVEYEDYSLASTLVTTATYHPFSFTLGVNPSLRSGLYRVGFKLLPYLDTSTYYTFTKEGSSLSSISSIEHYASGTVVPSGTTINSYVNFGYMFDFSSTSVTGIPREAAKAYQSSEIAYSLPFMDQIVVSDFATITNVTLNETTYSASNYRIYNISYTVLAENGINSTVYTHHIYERTLNIEDVYRNNNKVLMDINNPVIVTREAYSTSILINFGVDQIYASSIYNLEVENPNSYFTIVPDDVLGITISVTDTYLVFTVDSTAIAGDYEFAMGYARTGEAVINLGTLYITKNQGEDAYFTDIQFAELATETNYALIYVSNTEGIPDLLSPYSPTIYYAGIDYDGSKTAEERDFRVDGQVSNIPIDEYIPYFLNYLPLGATVAKELVGGGYTAEVTGPDDPNVYLLAADFTSGEVNEFDDLIITYRVTSENGLNQVYYHITVTDVTYNVSYIFEVIYIGNALQPDLDGTVIVINVKNMLTNLPVGDVLVTELPVFTTVTGYNNSTNLMFMLGHEDYKFRFGRNKSGFYSFSIDVLDAENYLYDYKIELNGTDELNTVSSYDPSSLDNGKYYYINSSTKNRTRYFTITIFDAHETPRDYGFVDKDESWTHDGS